MLNDLSWAAAHNALASWDIQTQDIEPLTLTENIVFKITDGTKQSFVLRLHRPGYHNLNELLSELQWTEALLDAGLTVPVPRTTRDGRQYVSVYLGNQHRYAGLLKWVDGMPMENLIASNPDSTFVENSFSLLGEVMAKFHNQAVSWTIPLKFSRHSFDADGLMGEAPFWGRFWESSALTPDQKIYFDTLRHNIYDLLLEFGQDPCTYSIIHADLHPANIVVEGSRLHVIDFDDSGFGWHGFDLAVAIWDRLDFSANGGFFEVAHEGLLEGYLEARQNTKAIIGNIPIFLLMRSLMLIGWIHERPEAGYSDFLPVLIQASKAQAKDLGLSD